MQAGDGFVDPLDSDRSSLELEEELRSVLGSMKVGASSLVVHFSCIYASISCFIYLEEELRSVLGSMKVPAHPQGG